MNLFIASSVSTNFLSLDLTIFYDVLNKFNQQREKEGNQRKINPEKKKHELMEAGNLHKRGKALRIGFLCWR